ncbi:hypothetical protein BGX24_006533, partial [Mortierella sp. AD032]
TTVRDDPLFKIQGNGDSTDLSHCKPKLGLGVDIADIKALRDKEAGYLVWGKILVLLQWE